MSSSRGPQEGATDGVLEKHFPTLLRLGGTFGWPLLLKQLRADFRRNRFFYSHFGCLALLGFVVIFLMENRASLANITPTQVGQGLFSYFFATQFLIVLVLFPAFTATSFTEERANLSLDFLIISRLTPAEIVLGKFLAATVYCFLYLLAASPLLLLVSFLFAGVDTRDVFAAYALLTLLTLLVSMASLWVSSIASGNLRATLIVYAMVCTALVYVYFFVYDDVKSVFVDRPDEHVLSAFVKHFFATTNLAANWMPLAVASFDALVLFTYLFICTANRLRPSADDRASHLRLLTLVYVPVRVLIWLLDGADVSWGLLLTAVLLLAATFAFSTEEASVSRKVRRLFFRRGNFQRVLAPGALTGFVYAVLLAVLCAGIFYATFERGGEARAAFDHQVEQSLLTLPLYIAAFASFGFLLAALDFSPLYARLTSVFLFLITLLLPTIFLLGDAPGKIYHMYYLSPVVLWRSLDPIGTAFREDEVSFEIAGVHIIQVARLVFVAWTVLNLVCGVHAARRAGYPLWRYE